MFKGRITISRQGGTDEYLPISIRIIDSNSGIKLCDLEMSFENLAKVITGQASIECDIKEYINEKDINKIGKNKKIKQINIAKNYSRYNDKDVINLLQEIEKILLLEENKDYKLWSNGLNSQQKNGHTITLVKYE